MIYYDGKKLDLHSQILETFNGRDQWWDHAIPVTIYAANAKYLWNTIYSTGNMLFSPHAGIEAAATWYQKERKRNKITGGSPPNCKDFERIWPQFLHNRSPCQWNHERLESLKWSKCNRMSSQIEVIENMANCICRIKCKWSELLELGPARLPPCIVAIQLWHSWNLL